MIVFILILIYLVLAFYASDVYYARAPSPKRNVVYIYLVDNQSAFSVALVFGFQFDQLLVFDTCCFRMDVYEGEREDTFIRRYILYIPK